jgi:hypothetical protein
MTRREFTVLASAAASRVRSNAAHLQNRRTLLFVDDHHVLYRSGTHLKVHPLKKYSKKPVLAGRVKPWEIAIGWSAAYRDPQSGLYQLWYQAFSGRVAQEKTKACVVCYAESKDGLEWIRPALNLFSYNGINDTNIVLIGNGGHSFNYGPSIVVNPQDPDRSRRYKMAYFDWSKQNGQEYPGLSVAFSGDGIHWRKYPQAPLLRAAYGDYGEALPYSDEAGRPWSVPLSISDALEAMYDPKRRSYEIYTKMWIDRPDGGMFWKHAMGRTVSSDFIHWSKPEMVLAPDDLDPPWLEFHASPVFYYNDCYFAILQILHREVGGGIIDVELATSRDGLRWERPFRDDFFLKRGDANHFDSGSIFLDNTVIYLDDEFRFYYGGYSGGATGGDDYSFNSGIGLATMERDRFASMKPFDHIGQITLKPVDLTGVKDCAINGSASTGSIRVEVLDAEGRRVHGFTRDDTSPLTGDRLAMSPRWNGRTLSALSPGRYMLRLHLENAEVFALSLNS